jgi:hypothetical protein
MLRAAALMKSALLLAALFALPASALAGQVTLGAVADVTLYSESGTLANGAGSFLFAGNNAQSNTRRALLRFDLASAIPSGSTITSVQLVLHMSQTNAGAVTQSLHRVSAGWGEGASHASGAEGGGAPAQVNDATWTQRFFGVALPWTTPGGDFAAAVSTQLAVDGIGTWTFPSTPAFVADAQAMLDAPVTDTGWIVLGGESSAGTAKRYDSRQNADPSVQPRLVVDFDPPCLVPATFCTAGPSSAGSGGAQIGWIGVPSVYANAFTLTAVGLPTSTTGMFYFGPTQASVPFGNGLRCVGGALRRLGVQTVTSGSVQRALDFTQAPGTDLIPGSTWSFQLWYLDPAGGGAGFNLSNGLEVTFCH